ncbi:MAG: hypothetical protein K0S26_813 [Bacteroidota bacterium]|nr:hypothetical protein [Bacteroidota bacterium]
MSQSHAQHLNGITVIKEKQARLLIKFNNDKPIHNLLVFVTDSAGQTIFLESIYNYKGVYNKYIDLPNHSKGQFTIHVNKDDERIIKVISENVKE